MNNSDVSQKTSGSDIAYGLFFLQTPFFQSGILTSFVRSMSEARLFPLAASAEGRLLLDDVIRCSEKMGLSLKGGGGALFTRLSFITLLGI